MSKQSWLTSQELCAKYGLSVTYKNASRAARTLVAQNNMPYYRVGYKWRPIGKVDDHE